MFAQILVFLMTLGAFAQTGVNFGLLYLALCGHYAYGLCALLLYVSNLHEPRVDEGVLIVTDPITGRPVWGSILFVVYTWFLSMKILNAIRHALNGNIAFWSKKVAMVLPFVVLFAIFFMVDLLTGFQFGFMGYFRVLEASSGGRFKRFWTACGSFIRKFVILSPLYVVLVLVSPAVLVLFIIYDIIAIIYLTFAKEPNTLLETDPHFERRVRVVKHVYDTQPEGGEVPDIIDGPNHPSVHRNPHAPPKIVLEPEVHNAESVVPEPKARNYASIGTSQMRRRNSSGSETVMFDQGSS